MFKLNKRFIWERIMKNRWCVSFVIVFFLATIFVFSQFVYGEEPKAFIPDKALCAKMLRFGKQAY